MRGRMKIKKFPALILLAVILLSILGSSLTVSADNRYYKIKSVNADIVINTDGSAYIEERITYYFGGSFNGITRDIDYNQTSGIEDLQLFVEERDGGFREISLNSSTDFNAEGPSGTYNIYEDDEIAHFKVYEKSSNTHKTFIYKYTFVDAVTKYNDTAEYYRKAVEPNRDVDIEQTSINIYLPEGASADELKVFGHGPLTGESRIVNGNHLEFILDDPLPPDYYLETRVLFPTRLVPDCTKKKAEEALPRILSEEGNLAEEANAQRERARKEVEDSKRKREAAREREQLLQTIADIIGVLLFFGWFPFIIYHYVKYDKELRPSFKAKYYRELPGDYTPAEMSILLSMGKVETRDITATLMDLVRKGHLILKKETYIKDGFFKDKTVEDYCLTLNRNAGTSNLKMHEAFLINWFIEVIGDGDHVFLDKISEYARTQSGAQRFSGDYKKWCDKAKDEADKNDFFDPSSKKGKNRSTFAAIAYIGIGILFISGLGAISGFPLIPLGVIMFIFASRLNKRTVHGNEQKAMWMAFKNFLKDFSRMDKAEMPSITIWEHYLVYAISLGVAKEVIRQLPLVFTDADLQNAGLTYMYGYSMHNFHSFTDIFDRTVSSVDHAVSHAISIANSTNSSASGSGGGFSGGGFSGGGGGGGGGGRGGMGAF